MRNLVKDYAQPTLSNLIDNFRSILRQSFPEFSLSLDGTPSFAEAECMLVRYVTKKFQILELVATVGLFKHSLTSKYLAQHTLSCINHRLLLPVSDWVAVQLDRASTNKSAIIKMKKIPDAKPQTFFCSSHGINNASKLMFKNAKLAENFKTIWQQMIQFSGQAREFSTNLFGQTIVQSKGV